MCCKSFWKKTVPFIMAFMLSFYVVDFTKQWSFANEDQGEIISRTMKPSEIKVFQREELGSGVIERRDKFLSKSEAEKTIISKKGKVQIISKPRAKYTDEARQNQIQGTVRLLTTLSAEGEVKNIVPVAGLPFGLTNQAMIAASQIKFKPAVRNGKSISTTVTIEYNFNIY